MGNSYARACTEILEILKYMPKSDMEKIPQEKINLYEKNKDTSYNYSFNPSIPLENQNISAETNAMIVILFRDYFATDTQKEKLKNILNNNDKIIEEKRKEKYNPNDIFKNKQNKIERIDNQLESTNNSLIEYKESIISKLFRKIKIFFKVK